MNSVFCEYKDIFGKPNTGVHSYRIFDIAIVDLLLTIIAAIIISYVINANVFIVLIVLLVIGIVLHRIFCVETTLNKLVMKYVF